MFLWTRKRKQEQWDGADRRSVPTVLVVNDDPAACEMEVRMISLKGYRAIAAIGADDAMWHVASELPRCVVLDVGSGGIGTSLKVLDTIRSHRDPRVNTTRVVLCASNPRNRSFSFQSGVDAYVMRPFHIDELTDEIAGVLALAPEDRPRHRRDELARNVD